jgi:hypothetical protein
MGNFSAVIAKTPEIGVFFSPTASIDSFPGCFEEDFAESSNP